MFSRLFRYTLGRRRTFSDDFQIKQNNDVGTLKKSCKIFVQKLFFLSFFNVHLLPLLLLFFSFQVSSTLQVPTHENHRNNNNNNISSVSHYDSSSLEDLNRELEKLCHHSQFKDDIIHNSRYYCDIFSRQSIESGEASSPELDDEVNRIRFVVDIPESGCELIVPKRPTAIPLNAIYQPCTNVQILKSSCSAFRDISEMKILQSSSQTEAEDNASASSSTAIAEEATNKDDEEEVASSSLSHTES
jgi:hypothetical protein